MPGTCNKREVGGRYEKAAADFLTAQGLKILEKNYRCRSGEVDLVVQDGNYLVFVEVKYRSDLHMGAPEESVDFRKRRRIRNVARYYLYAHGFRADTPCRFDVVSILGRNIRWIRNAF